jgi:hypothetical protein
MIFRDQVQFLTTFGSFVQGRVRSNDNNYYRLLTSYYLFALNTVQGGRRKGFAARWFFQGHFRATRKSQQATANKHSIFYRRNNNFLINNVDQNVYSTVSLSKYLSLI